MRGFVGLLQLECVQRGDADDEELSVADDDDYCIRSSFLPAWEEEQRVLAGRS